MYIVRNENELGYTIGKLQEGKPARMCILAVDYLSGGDPQLIGRVVIATKYREATKADESKFSIHLS